jgi:predicted nuclease of predicted toxin-antitoxin system
MPDFLVDESLPLSTAFALREQGYQARHVIELGLRGAKDHDLFVKAQEESWTIVTRDLGFGNLLDYPIGSHAGIIVLRVPTTFTARQINDLLDSFISDVHQEILNGALTVIEPGQYCIRQPEAG